MSEFNKCDMCVGDCSKCSGMETPYRVGRVDAVREFVDLIKNSHKTVEEIAEEIIDGKKA